MATKKRPKIHRDAGVRERPVAKAKAKRKLPKPKALRNHGWMVAGFDTSMSSLAGAAIAYDSLTKNFKGPAFVMRRWSKEDGYLERLGMAAASHELVLDLQAELGISMRTDEVFIAQEEPFPPHGRFMKGGASGFLKQQAEISGAFVGGLVRYGFKEFWQMHNTQWRKVIADMLSENGRDITTHHSKWKDPALCSIYNCTPADSGKFRSKQWAFDMFGIGPVLSNMGFNKEIPDWPDLIKSKDGHIPRPERSVAKAFQPDDRYDALAMMWALYLDLDDRGILVGLTK